MKVEQLKRLLTLALLSDNDGERIASLEAVKRVLATDGKDAYWLVEKLAGGAAEPQRVAPPASDWAVWLEYVTREPVYERLRWKEQEFITSLMGQNMNRMNWRPSEKQSSWLFSIYMRELQ